MNVNLGPTFDKFVGTLLSSGLYQSQSEIIREGLRLLKEQGDAKQARLQQFKRELAVGIEQADQGRFVNGEKVFQRLRKRGSERKRQAA